MRVIVTGATGFLGSHVCRRLLRRGDQVIALGRNREKGLLLEALGADFRVVDIRDASQVHEALENADGIVHCAALSSPWGSPQEFFESNVVGTGNVIQAAMRQQIRRFVHISSPSIYFSYQDASAIKETSPFPKKHCNRYAQSKRQAEEVVDAVPSSAIETITLRPQALFGPGDAAIVPRLLEANDKFGIPLVRSGRHSIDITYVDNAVDAILLALAAPKSCLGKKFNITNDEPIVFGEFVRCLFDGLGKEMRVLRAPYAFFFALAACLELVHRVFRPCKEPALTRYSIGVLSTTRTLDITAAKSDLGYRPRVNNTEGLKRVIAFLKEPQNVA